MFIIIVWFIAGFLIGLILGTALDNNREKQMQNMNNSQKDLLETYELYSNELKSAVKIYEDAMNQTLEENIYLRKKLKGMKIC